MKLTKQQLELRILELEKENLKLKKDSQGKQSYAVENLEAFDGFFQGKATIRDFPATKGGEGERYFFQRRGKLSFRYSVFVRDVLEAWAWISYPKEGRARYAMNRDNVIKKLTSELTRNRRMHPRP